MKRTNITEPERHPVEFPFILDLGSDSGANVRCVLADKLKDVDQIYISEYFVDTPSARRCKIKINNSASIHAATSAVCTTRTNATASRDPHAFYFILPAVTGLTMMGVARLFAQQTSWQKQETHELVFDITDWDGGAITYNQLILIGHYTKKEAAVTTRALPAPDPAALSTLNSWND